MFLLRKHYFDAIDPHGNCWIVYDAALHIMKLRIYYSAILFSGAGKSLREKSILRNLKLNGKSPGQRCIEEPAFAFKARYTPKGEGIEKELYQYANKGSIVWDCHTPLASVDIHFEGEDFLALGYAETISLPFHPKHLPIKLLRWGRFLANDISVTWIIWEGPHPKNQVFFNGQTYMDAVFEEHGFSFHENQFQIKFQEPILIREGQFGKIIRKYFFLNWLFQKSLLNSEEYKYKSETVLLQNGKSIAAGWSLFENVIFHL